nr:glutaredoxin 2 [Bacteriovorax sp. HI3]
MKLYHYVHCPFCVRVRMGFGLLGVTYESHVTPYDDETTPVKLTGKKMLPIVEFDGRAMNESLDILKLKDPKNLLKWDELAKNEALLNPLLYKIGSPVHSLAMPYWIWTPEFDENSRRYFQTKKEVKRGPFKDLVKNQQTFVDKLNAVISGELITELKPFYKSSELTIMDIMIAAHLWGMYVVPEFQFEPKVHEYLQTVKKMTGFNYHEDFWK